MQKQHLNTLVLSCTQATLQTTGVTMVAVTGLTGFALTPVMSWKALVAQVKDVAPGGYVVSLHNCINEERVASVVGWGRTLRLSIQSVPRRQLSRLSVVSLLGGLTRGSAMNPHETASHLEVRGGLVQIGRAHV